MSTYSARFPPTLEQFRVKLLFHFLHSTNPISSRYFLFIILPQTPYFDVFVFTIHLSDLFLVHLQELESFEEHHCYQILQTSQNPCTR